MPRLILLSAFALAFALLPPPADATGLVRLLADGNDFTMRLATVKELRDRRAFRTTIKQQHDFSCGSAAVATLLTYQYGTPVTEAEVFRTMYLHGDQAKIRRHGFSLLDMKRYLEGRGFRADGFSVPLDKLAEAGVPAIALVKINGYNHFVVIQGLRENKVLVGDPSAGSRVYTREEFDGMWQEKILFVIRSHKNLARFDLPEQWQVRLQAPLATESISRTGIADPTVMMRGPNDF